MGFGMNKFEDKKLKEFLKANTSDNLSAPRGEWEQIATRIRSSKDQKKWLAFGVPAAIAASLFLVFFQSSQFKTGANENQIADFLFDESSNLSTLEIEAEDPGAYYLTLIE